MRRDKKRNKIIIFILIGIVCMMGVGYAAFQTQLDIKGSTEISSEWDIKIISVEVSDIGGLGENVKNTYTDLTANLEANLYSKGDYVEYKVIVENAGTFDAKLDTLGITNSNNEAVKITSTGLVKGQTLYKGETVTLTVRIEYNSNYEGDASGTSGETTVDLGFVQNSEGTIVPTTDHLVTYDYTTNGGESTNAENEYVAEGKSINLSYMATKKNYEFKGWNTNPQAAEGLSDLTMGTEDITLYAIFEAIDTTPPVIESINTSSTTNSITAVVIASDEESGISKYEFSIDGGKTWIDNGVSNTYTFTGLKQGTSYDIDVRVTNGVDMNSSSNTAATTLTIEKPTFSSNPSSELYAQNRIVTVTVPCTTCNNTYSGDNGKTWEEVPSNIFDVKFQANGEIIVKSNDGTNEVASSYTVINIDSTPAGIIKPYAGNNVPGGYLLCDGSAVSRTTYAGLFETIGTTYGEGDGSTTFNLPDLSGRTIIGTSSSYELASTGGEEEHTLTISEMPSHSHNPNYWDIVSSPGGNSGDVYSYWLSGGGTISTYATASSRQSYATSTTGGSAAHNNMQPYVTGNYIIRY